jgi:hypothetical protein
MVAAAALVALAIFPLLAFDYSEADWDVAAEPVYETIAAWPSDSRDVALQLIDLHGVPDEITDRALIWHRSKPWEHTLVYRVESGPPTATPPDPRIETARLDLTQR